MFGRKKIRLLEEKIDKLLEDSVKTTEDGITTEEVSKEKANQKLQALRSDKDLIETRFKSGTSVFMPASEKSRIDKMWDEQNKGDA